MRGFRKGASISLLLVAGRNSLYVVAFPALWSMSKSSKKVVMLKKIGTSTYFTQSHSYLAHYAPLHSGAILACFGGCEGSLTLSHCWATTF